MGTLPLNGWWTEYSRLRLQRHEPQRQAGRRRARHPQLHAHPAQAGQLADGPRPDHRDHRRQRLLHLRGRLPARRVRLDRDGGLQRLLLHDRRHLPGRQPADPDHGQGRRRRRQHAQHHRPRRHHGLGRARLRPDRRQRRRPAQRRHRRLGQLRHHPQRARPAVRRRRGLAARRARTSRSSSTRTVDCADRRRRRRATPTERYELAADGSYSRASCSTPTSPRTGSRPTGCTARDVDGSPARPRRRRGRTWPSTRRPTASASRRFVAERAVRHLRRPTRARPTPTSAPRSTATTASATAASTARSTPPTRPTRSCTGGTFDAARRRRLPRQPRDPRRPHRQPDVQGDRRGGHQHRQRRPDRPAGAAAGVRRRRCTPSTSPATAPTATRRSSATAPTTSPPASRCPPRPRSTTRPSSTSAARPTRARPSRAATPSSSTSTTASRSCRCSTSSPTCRCPAGCAA